MARGKRKCLRGCLNSRAEHWHVELSRCFFGVCRLHSDLALIKARLPRRRQLAGCVYMRRVTLLLATLLLRSYFMYTLILWPLK